jgi:hypothetical protein
VNSPVAGYARGMVRVQVAADDIRRALATLDCPASKQDVVAEAERAGAPEGVVRTLRALPLGDYGNVDEIVRSVDTVEASGQSATEKAERARDRRGQMLAEHQRRSIG